MTSLSAHTCTVYVNFQQLSTACHMYVRKLRAGLGTLVELHVVWSISGKCGPSHVSISCLLWRYASGGF